MREFKNVLVTGGLGFIGSHFVIACLEFKSFQSIVVVDSGTYAANHDLAFIFQNDGAVVYKMDINDPTIKNVLIHHKIDLIVHFAAESHVTNSIKDASHFITTNVVGTFNLIEMARQVWGDRKDVLFHHVSTDEVYGSVTNQVDENCRYNPGNPYSASKAASDHIVEAYGNTYGIPYTISHGCNTFGPFQNIEKFIPMMVKKLCDGLKMTLHEGDHYRQWIDAQFHTYSIYLIIREGELNNHYNINLGDEYVINNSQILINILDCYNEIMGTDLKYEDYVEVIKDRPGNDHMYNSDNSKLLKLYLPDTIEHCKRKIDSSFKNSIQFYIEEFTRE